MKLKYLRIEILLNIYFNLIKIFLILVIINYNLEKVRFWALIIIDKMIKLVAFK